MNLLDAPNLGQQFDLIICSGVLHHLTDPGQGVRALSSVLEASHGALIAMLYGRLGRSGIYPLQDAFRRLQIPQSSGGHPDRPLDHQTSAGVSPGRRYFEYSPEMQFDAAIVDTFLHPQDIAYRVHEVLDLIEANGLKFQCWLDNGTYNHGWESLVADVPDRDRWSIVESLTWNITSAPFHRLQAGTRPAKRDRFCRRRVARLFPATASDRSGVLAGRRQVHTGRL